MKKLTIFIGVLLLLVLQTAAYPQVIQQWTATYNGPGSGNDAASKVAYDASGNVYIAGFGAGSTSVDYFIVKYNSAGVQQWSRTYNGTGNAVDEALDIAVDAAGNVYVTGKSIVTGSDFDYATIKYNTEGTLQWTAGYNGPGNGEDKATGIAVDAAGNVYVTGTSYGANNDYATIKYNASGIQLWAMRYNSTFNGRDDAMDIGLDGAGNIYVTGFSAGWGFDYATIKYNPDGVQQWVKRYDGPVNSDDLPLALAIDSEGNVCVTGYSLGNLTAYDYATVKYNSSGTELWVQRYNHTYNGSDIAVAIAVDASGNVFVTGNSDGSVGNPDYLTIKYNPAGVQQWEQRYNGSMNNADYSKAVAVDGNGNVYITGNCYNSGTGHDYVTVKYNNAGAQQWLKVFDGTLHSLDYGVDLTVGACNNVYVTGRSYNGSAASYDIVTIKYLQPACAPMLISPANNSFDIILTPVLDWNLSLDAVTYSLQVANNSGFTNPVINLTGITNHEYSVPANIFSTNKHYYWRVNAVNPAGTGDWSAVYNFWTYSTPVEKIQMLQATIDSLKNAGILNKGQANSLTVKLNNALKKIQSEQYHVAINVIEAFKNEVQALVSADILPPAIGENLLLRADALINQLNEMLAFDNSSEPTQSPSAYNLDQNYPNPFNPSTTIKFGIKENGTSGTRVKLLVYDITGRTVASLVDKVMQEGIYEVTFRADNLPSGIYFYKLTAGEYTAVKRMILMK
jgi:uncharacterized delta-60 repeat protein